MWSAWTRAIRAIKATPTHEIGAGQKATLIGGLLLSRLRFFWGDPVFPKEPESLSAASLQRQIDLIDMRLVFSPDDPTLTAAREAAWHLMWDRFSSQSPSLYSSAGASAEEYIAAEAALAEPIMPQRGRIDYAEIKRRISLLDWVMRFDEVKQAGRTFKAHCPLHADTNPSMTIYPDQDKWWCYVCNEGGDVIDYERARLNNDKAIPGG